MHVNIDSYVPHMNVRISVIYLASSFLSACADALYTLCLPCCLLIFSVKVR